ncbi:MAG: TolC family protein [Candidatus Gastranaerophilales bacterium]|nr:TolC family protein [Candidatus Gastranaerophilales bacterium]
MNKKIGILIIFLMLVNTSYSLAAEVQTDNSVPKTDSQFVLKLKKTFSFNKNKKANKSKITKAEMPQEVNARKLEEAKNKDAVKENKKIAFWSKKSKIQEQPVNETVFAVEKTPVENIQSQAGKKLERVVENKNLYKSDTSEEIKVLDVSTKAAGTVQGSVATDRIISVDDCVKLALEHNPSIKSALSSADAYKTKIAQAWSAYFPKIGLDLNYSKNDMLVTNFSFPTQKYDMYNMPKVSAELLLFDFGKAKAQADVSKKTFEAAEDNVQMSINDVIFNVKKSYYNLLYAMQQSDVYSKTVKDYELHLKQAQAFYVIGTKPKIDVMTAEYNLGKAKLDYIKAKNNIALAFAQVNNAMGLPEYSNYNISEKLDSYTYKVNFDDIIQTAYETRPEYLAAKKKSEGSEILVKATIRAFAPDIKAFGNYTLGGSTPAKDHGYQAGAQLTYNSFNAMLLKKQVDEAKANHKKDLADLEKSRQSVYLDVKQAYIDLYNSQDCIPVAKLAMKQAKEQYKLASGRYKVGLGDAVELKDAENTYRNAQLDYYSTLLNYNVAAANIERVIGAPIKHTDNSL